MTYYWLTPVESSYWEVSLPFINDNGGLLVKLRANPFIFNVFKFSPHQECSGSALYILPVLPLQVSLSIFCVQFMLQKISTE